MAGDKPGKATPRDPLDSDDIAAQATRREEIEPSNQLVLGESAFLSEEVVARKVGARASLPERIGQFKIVRELGRGGMGVVYLAKQPGLNREVALKVLNINVQSDPEDAARFRSEAKLAASLQHPNIVQIYEIGEQDGYAFIAMEFVRGGSLHQQLKERAPTPREAAELLEPLARAMHLAHLKGVIHRDLKPGNILISDEGTRNPDASPTDETVKKKAAGSKTEIMIGPKAGTPKITDFGLAKNLNQSMHLTATGVALGTPSYMAPEQARDDRKNIGPCSDIYALGTILYEMLTGKPPFSGSSPLVTMQQVVRAKPVPPTDIRPAVPRDLEAICLKCLEKHPKKRFATALELADALRGFLDGAPTESIPVRRRSHWPYYVTAAAVLIAVASLAVAYSQFRAAKDQEAKADRIQTEASQQTRLADIQQEQLDTLARLQTAGALEQALMSAELGQHDRAVQQLKSALELKSKNPSADLDRVIRFNLTEWNDRIIRPVVTAQHAPGINALTWSPDGKLIATAGEDGHLRFFTRAGKESGNSVECTHGTIIGRKPAQSVTWSHTGDRIAVGGYVGHVYLFDASKREAVGEPIKPDDLDREVWQTHLTQDGKTLITASADGGIRVFDVSTRARQAEVMPREPAGSYVAVALSADDKFLAGGGKSGTLRVWELKGREPTEHRSWKLGSEILSLTFSPDQRWLLAGTKSGCLFVWDRLTDRLLELPPEASAVRAVGFSADGQSFATGTQSGLVRIWDAHSRHPLNPPIIGDRTIRSLAFHPAERLLATGDDRGEVRIVALPRARQARPAIQMEPGQGSPVAGLAYSRDGKTLLTVANGQWRIWSGDSTLKKNLAPLNALVGSVHPDGNRIALGGAGGRLHLFDLAKDRDLLASIESPLKGDVCVVAFDPDGSALLTITKPTTKDARSGPVNLAWIWTVDDPRKPRQVFENITSGINAAVWLPDGKRIALACDDGKVILWDLDRNDRARTAFELASPVQCVAISGDGKRLAAGGLSGVGKVWNLSDGREVSRTLYHSERIAAIAFSADGRQILTGSHDKTARYWDAATGWPLGPPMHHPDAVLSVTFNPSTGHAVTGCKDTAVRFWRLPLAD